MKIHVAFDSLIGNAKVKHYLSHMVEKGRVGQSFLFAGPEGVGKGAFALALAKVLMCKSDVNCSHRKKIEQGNHPDIQIYRPEGKSGMHAIDSMRQLSSEVHMLPYEADKRIFIIHDAERMLPYSANALLKTFEEPPKHSLIILISSHPQDLLPTILSRCRKVYFQPIADSEMAEWLENHHSIEKSKAYAIAKKSEGSISQALRYMRHGQEPSHELLLVMLAKGKMATYGELKQFASDLAGKAEQMRDDREIVLRKEMFKIPEEDLTALQKDALEKEIEGTLANTYRENVYGLFHVILSWFRDMHLLYIKGDVKLLIHPHYQQDLEQAIQKGELRSLEEIQKVIDQAKLALDRFIPLNSILENLFLKMNFI